MTGWIAGEVRDGGGMRWSGRRGGCKGYRAQHNDNSVQNAQHFSPQATTHATGSFESEKIDALAAENRSGFRLRRITDIGLAV